MGAAEKAKATDGDGNEVEGSGKVIVNVVDLPAKLKKLVERGILSFSEAVRFHKSRV